MKPCEYILHLRNGDRVRFFEKDNNPNAGRECTIIRVLPNPSGRYEHQWYDVKFDDASMGRYLAKHLAPIGADEGLRGSRLASGNPS